MSTPQWQAADAARLKFLREKTHIEVSQFARMTTISIAQLEQLEGDGDSCFYSPLIKYQVGKKLLNLFGENPAAEHESSPLNAPAEADTAASQASPSKLNDKDQALASLDRIAEVSNREFNPPAHKAIACSVSLCWKEHVIFSRLFALFVAVLVGNYFFKAPAIALFEKYSSPNDKVMIEQPVSTLPEITSVAIVATSASAATPPASTKECAWTTDSPKTLASPRATKAGDYVYLVAIADISACVLDQDKQITTHHLKTGQSQTVNGKPPFRIYSEKMADIKIYYQGHRIIVPHKETVDILLTEITLKP